MTVLAAPPKIHDALIETTDRSCAVHYLSHHNTTGWFLTDVEGSCAHGVLHGDGYAVIRNAFGKEVERIAGFFTQGYWTGTEEVEAPLITLYLRESDVQTLAFDLGREDRLNIQYLGKMTATKRSDGTYGPFMTCEPFSVLAQTPSLDLFEDTEIQQELINSVINRAQQICPRVEQIYFYGSDKENPENQDIAFFADINMADRQIRVRRLPSSERAKNILSHPEMPITPRPVEVRQEKALPVVEVRPIKEINSVGETEPVTSDEIAQIIPIQQPSEPHFNRTSVFEIPQSVREETKTEVRQPEKESEKSSAESVIDSIETVDPAIEQKVVSGVDTLDAIPNLLTTARLLKQPVVGKALVRISRFEEDGTAIAEEPVILLLRGQDLAIGWGIVEGEFSYVPQTGQISGVRGVVQVKKLTPYHQE